MAVHQVAAHAEDQRELGTLLWIHILPTFDSTRLDRIDNMSIEAWGPDPRPISGYREARGLRRSGRKDLSIRNRNDKRRATERAVSPATMGQTDLNQSCGDSTTL